MAKLIQFSSKLKKVLNQIKTNNQIDSINAILNTSTIDFKRTV